MPSRSFISLLSCTLLWLSVPTTAFAASLGATAVSRSLDKDKRLFYTRAHSLDEREPFKPEDGWQTVNVSDLAYKYPRSELDSRATKSSKTSSQTDSSITSLGGTVTHLINSIWNGLKGQGSAQSVKITWYTGHDLLNPSCWSDSKWAPTDDSFACALTLQGWTSQPKCFKFLELCNGPKKCVFVRVVDSCAGCAPGSKHVDLTKGAFSQLASLDEGVLNVQMRAATDPTSWFEDLWGPKS